MILSKASFLVIISLFFSEVSFSQSISQYEINKRTPAACGAIDLRCDMGCADIFAFGSATYTSCFNSCQGKCKGIEDAIKKGASASAVQKMMPSGCTSKISTCHSQCSGQAEAIPGACESDCVGICPDLSSAFPQGASMQDKLMAENFSLSQQLQACQANNPAVSGNSNPTAKSLVNAISEDNNTLQPAAPATKATNK